MCSARWIPIIYAFQYHLTFVNHIIRQLGNIFTKSTKVCAHAHNIGINARKKSRLIEQIKEITGKANEIGQTKIKIMIKTKTEEQTQIHGLKIDKIF